MEYLKYWYPKTQLEKEGLKVVSLIKKSGFLAFWVGGTVRDILLRRKADNIDIATSLNPKEIAKLLRRAKLKTLFFGEKFGTICVATKYGLIEITTFRKESDYQDFRHPSKVEFVNSLDADSKRRDFTISAMYFDPIERKLFDPQKGLVDLENKIIRFVGDPVKRINEDPLRLLRAIRIAAQLNFTIEKKSAQAIKKYSLSVLKISKERVKQELDKIMTLDKPGVGLRLLDQLELLEKFLPELSAVKKSFHNSSTYHLEGNVFDHTLLTVDYLPENNLDLRYAGFFHDIGKDKVFAIRKIGKDKINSFQNHHLRSVDKYKLIAKRLGFSKASRSRVLWLIENHDDLYKFDKLPCEKQSDLIFNPNINDLILLGKADDEANIQTQKMKKYGWKEAKKLLIKKIKKEKIVNKFSSGKFLIRKFHLTSDKFFGKLQKEIKLRILFNKIKNFTDLEKFLANTLDKNKKIV
jgi:tRNA nucleotidyltransferase/poly(A) polymerase